MHSPNVGDQTNPQAAHCDSGIKLQSGLHGGVGVGVTGVGVTGVGVTGVGVTGVGVTGVGVTGVGVTGVGVTGVGVTGTGAAIFSKTGDSDKFPTQPPLIVYPLATAVADIFG